MSDIIIFESPLGKSDIMTLTHHALAMTIVYCTSKVSPDVSAGNKNTVFSILMPHIFSMSCFSSSALGRSRLLPSTRTWNMRRKRKGRSINSTLMCQHNRTVWSDNLKDFSQPCASLIMESLLLGWNKMVCEVSSHSSWKPIDLARQTMSSLLSAKILKTRLKKNRQVSNAHLSVISLNLSYYNSVVAVITNNEVNPCLSPESLDHLGINVMKQGEAVTSWTFGPKGRNCPLTGIPCSCGLSKRLCSSFLEASIFSLSAASTM